MSDSQKNIVLKELKETGKVSRDWCLQRYISRLSAIICDLKKEGLVITGDYENRNYVYRLQTKTHEDITDPDEELERLKAKTPVNWENQTKLKEINKALKSKDEYYKKSIIIKYS